MRGISAPRPWRPSTHLPKITLWNARNSATADDLSRIDGIDVTTALAEISETGTDMSRSPTAAHFASWVGPYPGTKITGGKVMSGIARRTSPPRLL